MQPDRNIASRGSCVALVMIFHEGLTESSELTPELQPDPENPQNNRLCDVQPVHPGTSSHVVVSNPPLTITKSTPTTPQ